MLSVAINKFRKPFHDSAVVLHIPDDNTQLVHMGHIRSRIHSYTIIFGFFNLIYNFGCNFFCLSCINSLYIVEDRKTHLYQNYQIGEFNRQENRQITLVIQVVPENFRLRRFKYFISPKQRQTSFTQELGNGHNFF